MHSSFSAVARGDVGDPQSSRGSRLRARLGWVLFGALWLGILAYGLHDRFLHATTAGAAKTAPQHFPADSRLLRAGTQSALFMFVHPECPCTRASLHELSEILAAPHAKVSAVLVVAPALSSDHSWEHTSLAEIANDIPGLTWFMDRDGAEAARFGAETSGHVVLYDAAGRLQFAGGITGSRGHVGDNVGLRTVKQLIEHSVPGTDAHSVYGCPLEGGGAR